MTVSIAHDRRGVEGACETLATDVRCISAEGRGEQPEFIRNQYYGLEWREGAGAEMEEEGEEQAEGEALGTGVLVGDADLYCELRLQRAGSFHYYFVYDTA